MRCAYALRGWCVGKDARGVRLALRWRPRQRARTAVMPGAPSPRSSPRRWGGRPRGRAGALQSWRRAATGRRGCTAGEQSHSACPCAGAPPHAGPNRGPRCPSHGAPAASKRTGSAGGISRRCQEGRRRANTASGPVRGASLQGAKRDAGVPAASTTAPIHPVGARQAPVARRRPCLVCAPLVGSRRRRRPPARRRTPRRPAPVSANAVRALGWASRARAAQREALSRPGFVSPSTPLAAHPAWASAHAPTSAAHRRTAAAHAGGQRSSRPHSPRAADTPASRWPARRWPWRRSEVRRPGPASPCTGRPMPGTLPSFGRG